MPNVALETIGLELYLLSDINIAVINIHLETASSTSHQTFDYIYKEMQLRRQ